MTLKPLTIEQLYRPCDLTQFSFESTAELKPLDQPLGQERALEAIEFAVDIEQEGFNLFVLGATGLGKHQLVVQKLIQHAAIKQPQYDWCYVNNFENPQRPKLLKLPAGMGSKLRKDMKQLVEDLLTALPTTFQSDEYHSRRQDIENESKEHYDQAFRKLDSEAKERGITLVRTPSGYTLAPMIDDKIVTPEQFEQLPKERRNQIEKEIANIQLKLQTIVRDLPLMRREISQRIKALNKEFTQLTVEQFIAWIENTKAPLVVSQTIEPTQVAGFNQIFDDTNGTQSRRIGLGLDAHYQNKLFSGFEVSSRNLIVPTFSGNDIFFQNQKEKLYRAYLYGLLHENWVAKSEVQFEEFSRAESTLTSEPHQINTLSFPTSISYFNNLGIFSNITGTFVHQEVDRRGTLYEGIENFFLVDASFGYRFPNRTGIFSIEARNIFDQDFLYRNTNFITAEPINSRVVPTRTIFARFTLNF